MSNNYNADLERHCEVLQEQVTKMRSLICKFICIKICQFPKNNQININLERYNIPCHKDKQHTVNTTTLLTATKTKVDEVERYYLEFHDDSRGYMDLPISPMDLAFLAVNKFELHEIPIDPEINIIDPDNIKYGSKTQVMPTGFVYAPYVPMHLPNKLKYGTKLHQGS